MAHKSACPAIVGKPLGRPSKQQFLGWDPQNSRHFQQSHDLALGSFSSDQNPFGGADLSPQQGQCWLTQSVPLSISGSLAAGHPVVIRTGHDLHLLFLPS